MADRIAVMNQGRIVQLDTGEKIYRDPATRFVASFIGDANLIKADGGKVLMVRPEDIGLGPPPSADYMTDQAVVKERIFVGNAVRLHAERADGQEIVVHVGGGQSDRIGATGSPVALHWRRDLARLLDDTDQTNGDAT